MSYPPRIESKEYASFLTTRSRNSELWFVNNPKLEETILGYAAKYSGTYGVQLYALAIEGNHIQGPASFPNGHRSDFMRDFKSTVARAVPQLTKHRGGTFWGRRYSQEFLPGDEDVEEYFFYTVLQPVQDGLVENISEYPGYNCFHDAVYGITKKFKMVRWRDYNEARRRGRSVSVIDYTYYVHLQYQRLPGHEDLTQKEYANLMHKKLEERRRQIVKKRKAEGKGFLGRERLLQVKPGSLPRKTKKSTRNSHRPRVLSVCNKRRAECKAWYFQIYNDYQEASAQYRGGDFTAVFPPGTYKPWVYNLAA